MIPSVSLDNTDDQNITPLTDIGDLEDRGHRIVECMAGDLIAAERTRKLIDRLREEKRDSFFGDLLFYLTSERYPETQARAMWEEILVHKYLMSEKLGRNVGIRVSSIDYLVNVRKLIHAPRIIKTSDFHQTIKMARTDGLTGLYNRRFFGEQFKRILEVAARLKAPVSLMMTDLDNFKQFNDRHGHQAGDLFLQEVSRLVRGCVRTSDLVSRYGGDEFALLLPKANKAEAAGVAEKIRQQIEENFHVMGITISIGIAQYPDDGLNRDDLVAAADEALYSAKSFGRNRVSFLQSIFFRYIPDEPDVRQVALAGDFNSWNRNTHPLTYDHEKRQWVTLLSLKPGRYRYKFLINNERWIPDPRSDEFEPDGYGGLSSSLVV